MGMASLDVFRPGPEYRAGICGRSHCTARLCRRELLQPELKHRWGAAHAKMADQCVPAISGPRCRLLTVMLARGVVRYDRSASSYPICLSLPATQVCHMWSARCNASQQDGFTRCFFGQVQSTELEFVAEATVQRGCVVASCTCEDG